MKRITFLVLITLTIIALPVYSQGGQWSEPVQVSLPEATGWFPDIIVDKYGQIHIVWAASTETSTGTIYHDITYTGSPDGEEWTTPVDIMVPELSRGEATRPALYTDEDGVLHMTYRGTRVYYSHVLAPNAGDSTAWMDPRLISAKQISYFSRLLKDSQGTLHLVYTENVPTEDCQICYHIFHRRSEDGGFGWSNLNEISKLLTGSAKPQIAIDSEDNLYVVWEAGFGGAYGQLTDPTKAMFSASFDGGSSWTSPLEFLSGNEQGKNVTIGIDGQDTIVVAWLAQPDNLVYYQYSQDKGQSWSVPRSIPGVWGASVTRLDDYAMSTDSAGNIHLIMVGRTNPAQASRDVLHLAWNGRNWSEPEVITSLEGDVPEWPRLAIGNGNQLHATWFVRDEEHVWESDKQEYEIWYAHRSVPAPAIEPEALPTPTSLAAVNLSGTPTPVPTLAPTPTPTLDPALLKVNTSAEITNAIYTDSDEVLLILKSLAPALLVIALLMVGIRVWRR